MNVSRVEFRGDAAADRWLNELLHPAEQCDIRPKG
jgi:hypothetical protein